MERIEIISLHCNESHTGNGIKCSVQKQKCVGSEQGMKETVGEERKGGYPAGSV